MARSSMLVAFVAAQAGLVIGACTTDVALQYGACEVGDDAYDVGETFLAKDGCSECTCKSDGTVDCPPRCCVPVEGDPTLEPSESFVAPDGCLTCDCVLGPEGTPTLECTDKCACDGQPSPDCGPVPFGCYYASACESGAWSCGPLVCEGTCYYDDGTIHVTGEVFPSIDGCNSCYCGEFGQIYCTSGACPACADPEPPCDDPANPAPPPGCFLEPVCVGGMAWECLANCAGACAEPAPECPLGEPNCSYDAVCTPMGWICEQSCQGMTCAPCSQIDCGPSTCFESERACGICVQ